MGHTPHELQEEFPEHAELIHRLKVEDPHFARLAEEYHEVNRAVHRAESGVEPMAPEAEEALRRKRLHLKDRIYALLKAASAEAGA
ncbi:MAG: DUF465 domain-containing protein [Alphaproteobacteria bacterium]|nr:MAG: DUF465 domain-containing protein [Alphaproteobacteria bacterium]